MVLQENGGYTLQLRHLRAMPCLQERKRWYLLPTPRNALARTHPNDGDECAPSELFQMMNYRCAKARR